MVYKMYNILLSFDKVTILHYKRLYTIIERKNIYPSYMKERTNNLKKIGTHHWYIILLALNFPRKEWLDYSPSSHIVSWEPEGGYCCIKNMAIASSLYNFLISIDKVTILHKGDSLPFHNEKKNMWEKKHLYTYMNERTKNLKKLLGKHDTKYLLALHFFKERVAGYTASSHINEKNDMLRKLRMFLRSWW